MNVLRLLTTMSFCTAALTACQSPPARTTGLTWSYVAAAGPDPARLYYGAPDTDLFQYGFECAPGTGRVTILAFSDDPRTPTVDATLESGGHRRVYQLARGTPASEVLGWFGETAANDPPLVAFARSGVLKISIDAVSTSTNGSPSVRKAVLAFWRACQG